MENKILCDIRNIILDRISYKVKNLDDEMECFEVLCDHDKTTDCFEINAINRLLSMHKIKAEISELEYLECIIGVYCNKQK